MKQRVSAERFQRIELVMIEESMIGECSGGGCHIEVDPNIWTTG
jgi:hypothetical protein